MRAIRQFFEHLFSTTQPRCPEPAPPNSPIIRNYWMSVERRLRAGSRPVEEKTERASRFSSRFT